MGRDTTGIRYALPVRRPLTAGGYNRSMALHTTVGALRFMLHASARVRLPELHARPLLFAHGVELGVVDEDGASYLVVDHRADVDARARVEIWRPLVGCEGNVAGLVMIADTALPGPAPAYGRIAELDAALV
jgi:hypothetical protein